jgi:hypothetical protein
LAQDFALVSARGGPSSCVTYFGIAKGSKRVGGWAEAENVKALETSIRVKVAINIIEAVFLIFLTLENLCDRNIVNHFI